MSVEIFSCGELSVYVDSPDEERPQLQVNVAGAFEYMDPEDAEDLQRNIGAWLVKLDNTGKL